MVITVKSKSKDEDNPQPKPISKLLKGLLFFILFFFGMDFGLIKYKSRRQKITVKMWCLSIVTVFVICFFIMIYYLGMQLEFIVFNSKCVFENYIHVLTLLLISDDKTFCSFLEDLNSIDLKLGVDSDSFHIDVKIYIYFIMTLLYKSISSFFYCHNTQFNECIRPVWIQVLYNIPYGAIDFPSVILFFLFYAARCRLSVLRKAVESNKYEPTYLQNIYKSLINSTEKYKEAFNPIVSV